MDVESVLVVSLFQNLCLLSLSFSVIKSSDGLDRFHLAFFWILTPEETTE